MVDHPQNPLFVSDIYDALSDLVRALGGPKKVGALMRPELPVDQAGRWVADCLNREHRARFDPQQVMWLLRQGRAAQCHSAMGYIATECGYAEPVPVDAGDAKAKVLREVLAGMAALQKRFDELLADHKLPAPLRRVL